VRKQIQNGRHRKCRIDLIYTYSLCIPVTIDLIDPGSIKAK